MTYYCDAHGENAEYVGITGQQVYDHIEKEHGDEAGSKDGYIKFEEDHIFEE